MTESILQFNQSATSTDWGWSASKDNASFTSSEINQKLKQLDKPCYVVLNGKGPGLCQEVATKGVEAVNELPVSAFAPVFGTDQLGDESYRKHHNVKYAYYAGAMANGISSEELVIALGQAGILCSFGAAGLIPSRVKQAIDKIQAALPNGPYAFNLIHSPSEPALERGSVELFIKHGVHTVEASAFLSLTPQIVYYRAAGLSKNADGTINIGNKVIAKVSRTEVASKFMMPAPQKMLQPLVDDGSITAEQMELAMLVPMADDVTAEADSGGHTDNRPLVTLLPTILALRDKIQNEYKFPQPVRVGVGGGVGTANAALAAFTMGAAYIVTGSVNQACFQAGASDHTRKLLSGVDMADVTMAPAADMFEMGVKLQVVKRGTMFAMRANKLYDLYIRYDSIEDIPEDERQKLEQQVFRQTLDEIWQGTVAFFNERDPKQIERCERHPKRKMALIFRWYLGLSSRWSNTGEQGREMDYQIWAGPALGAFNEWVKGTYLEDFTQRDAVDVANHLMQGAAYLHRVQTLKSQGLKLPLDMQAYNPTQSTL